MLMPATNGLLLLPLAERQKLAGQLEQILLANLRRGDVVCKLGESQFVLLLVGMSTIQMKKMLQRIRERYRREQQQKGTDLRASILPGLPLEIA